MLFGGKDNLQMQMSLSEKGRNHMGLGVPRRRGKVMKRMVKDKQRAKKS
jgi:hypothetical protein